MATVSSSSLVKVEHASDGDNSMDALDILALASCTTQLHEENIEFTSTEVMPNPFNNKMCCLHCLQDVEKDQVSNHMVHEHGYRKIMFKCQICTSTFDLKNELTEHKLSCRIEPKRKKRKSVQQILKDLDFKIDPDLDESDIMVSCPICLLELPKTDIRDHIVEIHSNPYSILTCGLCNRNFKSKITLRDHIKLVHEVGTSAVPCEVCGQVFRSKKYLSNHRRNVHGDKEFKCDNCGKIFKSHLSLHQHSKYVHPPESATAPCPHCSKVFKSKTNLHQHVKIMHLGKRKSRGGEAHHSQTM